jgi:hypothetical protein
MKKVHSKIFPIVLIIFVGLRHQPDSATIGEVGVVGCLWVKWCKEVLRLSGVNVCQVMKSSKSLSQFGYHSSP